MNSRDRRNMAFVVGGTAIVVLVGVGVVLQHRLATITRTSATELLPTRYELHPPDFPFLSLDLGYLKVALPAAFDGPPQEVAGTNCVQVQSTRQNAAVAFMVPHLANDSTDNSFQALLLQFASATGRPAPTLFALQRLALETEPFDLWDLPRLGVKESKTRLALLAIKELVVGSGGTRVRILETDALGAIIISRSPNLTTLDVCDRRRGTMQTVLIQADPDLADRTALAVLTSYQLTTDDFPEDAGATSENSSSAPAGVPPQSTTGG